MNENLSITIQAASGDARKLDQSNDFGFLASHFGGKYALSKSWEIPLGQDWAPVLAEQMRSRLLVVILSSEMMSSDRWAEIKSNIASRKPGEFLLLRYSSAAYEFGLSPQMLETLIPAKGKELAYQSQYWTEVMKEIESKMNVLRESKPSFDPAVPNSSRKMQVRHLSNRPSLNTTLLSAAEQGKKSAVVKQIGYDDFDHNQFSWIGDLIEELNLRLVEGGDIKSLFSPQVAALIGEIESLGLQVAFQEGSGDTSEGQKIASTLHIVASWEGIESPFVQKLNAAADAHKAAHLAELQVKHDRKQNVEAIKILSNFPKGMEVLQRTQVMQLSRLDHYDGGYQEPYSDPQDLLDEIHCRVLNDQEYYSLFKGAARQVIETLEQRGFEVEIDKRTSTEGFVFSYLVLNVIPKQN